MSIKFANTTNKSSAAVNAVFGAAMIAVVAKVGHEQVSYKGGD